MKLDLKVTKKQKKFIDARENEVLFGGAAGGGKSYGQIVDALLFALKYPGSKQLILRRTFSELDKSLIRTSLGLYPREIYTFNSSSHTGRFKNGSCIDFGYCANENDVYQYQSAEYDCIRFDELTHFTEMQYVYLISRVRGANSFPKQIKSSTNPGGVGHSWVKARFVDPAPSGESFIGEGEMTRVFLPSLLKDNDFLNRRDPSYRLRLEALPEREKKALLFGDWNIFEGQYFTEFSTAKHACEPFEIPPSWRKYRTVDYGLDLGIISSGALVKKGYSFLIANVGKTVAIITLFITALISFTEISFSDFGGESFTSTLIMMLLASYIMYFSLEDAGEKLGRESDEYKATSEKYDEVRGKVSGSDISALRKFCLDYRNADLEYRRSNLLFSLGYTDEEYERYLNGDNMGKKAEKALRRVKKIKRAELDAVNLLSAERRRESELRDPKTYRLLNMLIRLIPSTVCMLFTVSVMISTRDNMTVAGIIEALLKLSTLPVIGLKGYAAGYQYATESEQGWLEIKTRLLGSFISNKNK